MQLSFKSLFLVFIISFSLFAQKAGYLVITESQYENDENLQEFISFRELLYDVTVVSVSEAGGSVSAIKSYIKNVYQNDNVKYVLFIGKASQNSSGIPYETDGYPTYHNYGLIDNDNYLDVYVGCFFVRSATDLGNIIYKTMHAENNASEYPMLSTQFSSFRDDAHISDECGLIRDRYWDAGDVASDWMVPEPYGIETAFVQPLINRINNNETRIVTYQGHGATTYWCGSNGSGQSISSSQVTSLSNDEVYPVIWSMACVTGSFQQGSKCFGETWTTSENGACAFIGASNNSYVYQKMLNAGLACGINLKDDIHTLGQLFAFAKSFVRDSMHIANLSGFEKVTGVDPSHENMYNLFGDPALELKETPDLTPIVSSAIIHNSSSIRVNAITKNSLEINAPKIGRFVINLLSANGRMIKQISSGMDLKIGNNKISWHGSDISNGVYLINIKSDDIKVSSKVVLQ